MPGVRADTGLGVLKVLGSPPTGEQTEERLFQREINADHRTRQSSDTTQKVLLLLKDQNQRNHEGEQTEGLSEEGQQAQHEASWRHEQPHLPASNIRGGSK